MRTLILELVSNGFQLSPTDMFSSVKVIIFYDCPKSIVSGRTIHVNIVSVM